MTLDRSITYLKFACGFSILMGILVLLALATQSYGLFSWFMDLIHLPLDGAQRFGGDSERVLGAISGGLLIGMGLMVWQITTRLYAHDPALGGSIILWGIWGWYLTDSAGSVLAGAWFNAVLNTGFLLMFVMPIAMAKQRRAAAA